MKKSTLTEDKAEQTPTGGVLVGKRKGQTIIHNKGTLSGYLVGKTHAEGGIKAVNKSTGQALEMQGGEVVITAPAVSDNTKREFEGKMMTNREILSTINKKGGGVSFAKGGDVPKNIKRTGASYKYGGKTMTDHEIYKSITGGHLAEGMTLSQIAKKHNVSVKDLQRQVEMGIKSESEHTSSKREQMKIVKDHLFENPKYYSLLKRAGLKHGGKISRANVIRNTKRANEQTKDLNNANDVLDIDADGIYGAETSLYADGGNIKPYDANMEGDSADMMFAKGGITDVTVNNWNDIPDALKNIRLPKKIDYDINPDNNGFCEILKPFIGTEKLRPAMQGINFDDNGVTVTNTHILLTIPTSQDYFRGVYKPNQISTKIDVNFPKYEAIIPKEKDTVKVFYIDVLKLLTYCKVALNYSDKRQITFKVNGAEMYFDPVLFIDFLSSLIKLTGQVYWNVSYQTSKTALAFTKYPSFELGKDIIALMMPYIYGKDDTYGAINKGKNTELNVYFDFDDNEIRNADDSIVDLSIKPTKERAKRTPRVAPSQTTKQKSKTLTKEELEQSRIWIGNDLRLRDWIMQKLTKIGIPVDSNYGDSDLSETENLYIVIFTDDFVVYKDSKEFFDNESKKEIFASDLGISSIDTLDETITDEDVEIKKMILAFIKEGSWSLEKEIKTKTGDSYFKDFYKSEPPTIYRLTAIKGVGLYPTDEKTLKFLDKFGFYDDYEEPIKETSFVKFSSGDIDAFNQIDAIVKSYGITLVSTTQWNKDDKTTDFDIVNTLTGDVFQLRKYNLSLGVQIDDTNKDKSTALIKDYNKWKKSTPTKETKKIIVLKLSGLSDEGTLVSDFGVYGGKELLENIKLLENKYPERESFPYFIYDMSNTPHGSIIFGRGIKTVPELEISIIDSPIFDDYDWKDFVNYGTPFEQPKLSQTEKPKRNFELERKYLSQRISDLAKELDLKKPILSNEEVAFYQREINSFILKLRKLNDAEMSLKPIEERVGNVYGLKFASFDNEYPETDMISINALKSQLTEKEYFNVRTPEFKSFFGDWETAYLNDSYAGVSKVINPITKEPQPVFHGTNVLFVNWKTYDSNNAHYFAVKREFSEFFATSWEERTDKAGVDSEILKKLNPNKGRFLFRCFIDVKNPIDFSRFGVEKYPIREFLTFLRVNYNIGDFDFWTNITSHSGFTQDTEVYAWQIIRLWQSFTKYVKVFTTYDGYIFYEYIPTTPYGGLENASLSYCAFESNQIKFTDAYEFNALSNDSRFDLGGIL